MHYMVCGAGGGRPLTHSPSSSSLSSWWESSSTFSQALAQSSALLSSPQASKASEMASWISALRSISRREEGPSGLLALLHVAGRDVRQEVLPLEVGLKVGSARLGRCRGLGLVEDGGRVEDPRADAPLAQLPLHRLAKLLHLLPGDGAVLRSLVLLVLANLHGVLDRVVNFALHVAPVELAPHPRDLGLVHASRARAGVVLGSARPRDDLGRPSAEDSGVGARVRSRT